MRTHRIPRDFLNRDQILTNCFLNPQGFDGGVLESSTTTSEHDGTTRSCIHAMNDTTPVLCETHASCEEKNKVSEIPRKPAYSSASPELKAIRV